MKNIILIFVLFTIFFSSCEKDNQIEKNQVSTKTVTNVRNARWYLYYCSWDSWGHGSSCTGMGLCNYTDCWFCNVDDIQSPHIGQVFYDKITKEGFLIIKLDLSEQIQKDAISNKSDFYVDNDIEKSNTILRKGIYSYDKTIGEYGGYKLNITVK